MKRENGFTLLELLVILAVVAILASLSFAGYTSLIEGARLSTAANDIKGDLQLARLTAVRRHVTILAYFNDGTGPGGSYFLCVTSRDGEKILTRAMPKQVSLTGVTTPIEFNTLGIASVPGSVKVSITDPAKEKTIAVSAAGNITLTP